MISLEDDIAQSMERAMIFAAFMDKLGDCASRTVAGAPPGLSQSSLSQAKPLIDYRKEANDA